MYNPAAIDLTASFEKPSTCAWIDGSSVKLLHLRTNQELAGWLMETGITHVGLDAPLTIPTGLNGKFGSRQAERDLLKAKIPVLATSLLAPLTFRAIQLTGLLDKTAIRYFEIYPFAIRHFFSISPTQKKQAHLADIVSGIKDKWPFNWKLPQINTHDEADAILGLWMVLLIHDGKAKPMGTENEGLIWIPDNDK